MSSLTEETASPYDQSHLPNVRAWRPRLVSAGSQVPGLSSPTLLDGNLPGFSSTAKASAKARKFCPKFDTVFIISDIHINQSGCESLNLENKSFVNSGNCDATCVIHAQIIRHDIFCRRYTWRRTWSTLAQLYNIFLPRLVLFQNPFFYSVSVQYALQSYDFLQEWRKNPNWSSFGCLGLLLQLNNL